MIPILYDYSETAFNSEGLGRVPCVSCKVTEEINGIPECEFKVLQTESIFPLIRLGSIIYTTHDETKQPQPYEVYAISEPLDDVITFNARHIVARLRNYVVKPYTASGVGLALVGLKENIINEVPFTFSTTKSTIGEFKLESPATAKDVLGGVRGSILDTYTGEYEFNKFAVTMHNHIGIDSGVEIRYGNNLVSYKHEKDLTSTYNAAVPFWRDEENDILVTLPEWYIVVGTVEEQRAYLTASNNEYINDQSGNLIDLVTNVAWFYPLDMSQYFENQPSADALRTAAISYMTDNQPYLPKETFDVDFVQLWQTGEYPEYEGLQRVKLGDTVSVFYPSLNVTANKIRVVKTVYDSLLDRYELMTLGQKHSTLGNSLSGAVDEAIRRRDIVEYDVMAEAIKNATDLLTGEKGGNIIFDYDANGMPREMLIMDTADKTTAQNVWRFNASGWGHSSTGIEGPYRLAATQDGSIVADFITSGQLNAGLITTGELSASRIKGGTFDGEYINVINLNATNVSMDGLFNSVQHDPIADETDNTITIDGGSVVLARSNTMKLAELMASYYLNQEYYGYPLGGALRLYEHDGGQLMAELAATPFGAWGKLKGSNGDTIFHVNKDTFFYYAEGHYGTAGFVAHQFGVDLSGEVICDNDLTVYGSKHRAIKTKTKGTRLLEAYETAEPYFGDIGESVISENGYVTIPIEAIFAETIQTNGYQVFLQKYGQGDCWVSERGAESFTVSGTAGLAFAWELKAKQIDYDGERLKEVKR